MNRQNFDVEISVTVMESVRLCSCTRFPYKKYRTCTCA